MEIVEPFFIKSTQTDKHFIGCVLSLVRGRTFYVWRADYRIEYGI